jgi:hypothetical protein
MVAGIDSTGRQTARIALAMRLRSRPSSKPLALSKGLFDDVAGLNVWWPQEDAMLDRLVKAHSPASLQKMICMILALAATRGTRTGGQRDN